MMRSARFQGPGQARGLTLLELAIALAILVLLTTLAVPTLGERLDRQRLYTAAEMLAADIHEARFEAARQGQAMHVLMQPGPAWCWSVARSESCPCGQGQSCELKHARPRDHTGVQLVSGQSMHLMGSGQAQSPAYALLQSRAGAQLRVEVNSLGRPRICSVNDASTKYASC